MKALIDVLKLLAGAGLLAAVMYLLLAMPGFVSDRSSTIPIAVSNEAAP